MPCPHNEISIVQRSHRQSAVAAAAYQSGEKLFCEYDQKVKHYPEKRGIVHNEILLPANAPRSYADRNTLWNAAEAVEKQWNSQLARRWVLTIPREIPPDQYAALVRDFCNQQFVSKGMCVDFAIHDKGDGNPHAHVMLTMRAMDERGKWLPKSRKVYELDKNGERIKLPSGRWKSHKEDTVDWNDRKYGEIWRHEWEVIQNRYLEANNRPERVDLRSYERQGLDIIPTVHEGAAVRQMEKRGIQTNIGNLNREIKAANSLMKSMPLLEMPVLRLPGLPQRIPARSSVKRCPTRSRSSLRRTRRSSSGSESELPFSFCSVPESARVRCSPLPVRRLSLPPISARMMRCWAQKRSIAKWSRSCNTISTPTKALTTTMNTTSIWTILSMTRMC